MSCVIIGARSIPILNNGKKIALGVALCLLLVYNGSAHAAGSRQSYALAVRAARQHDYDAAFMYFRAVLREPVTELYREQALFATGEYYYLKGIHTEARRVFADYLKQYPSEAKRIFALAYLLALAQETGQTELAERISHQIITMQQVSLLFRETKEYEAVSALQRNLKVVYYIDKVEFYADQELFQSIPY